MPQEQKNELIKQYITQLAIELNTQYPNLFDEAKIKKAYEIFQDSNQSQEEIKRQITILAYQTIKNHQIQHLSSTQDSKKFLEIKEAYRKLQALLQTDSNKIYLAGGTVPYFLLNQDSQRLHNDIDTICNKSDISDLRTRLKQTPYYISEWDSLNFTTDGRDYGLEILIDNVPVGIYPYTYQNNQLIQYSWDPYTKSGKIKEFPLTQITDYVLPYRGKDGQIYHTMSLEYIFLTKAVAQRPKDIQDIQKIKEIGIRQQVMSRISMYQQTQKQSFSNSTVTNKQTTQQYTQGKNKILVKQSTKSNHGFITTFHIALAISIISIFLTTILFIIIQ